MSEVYVDGEKVTFEGDFPENPAQVYELLMSALSEQGRAVTGFKADGVDLLAQNQDIPKTFERIDADSLSHRKLTLRVTNEFLTQMKPLAGELRAYAINVLTIGWSEVFRRMEEFIGKIKPFADLLDNLGPYAKTYSPPWNEGLEKLAAEQSVCLEAILGAFEAGNAAGLSDEVALNFAPLFDRCRKFLSEKVVVELGQEQEGAT
jgi:hypothetical protein